MLTSTCGPGGRAVWDVTPGSVAILAGREASCRPLGAPARPDRPCDRRR